MGREVCLTSFGSGVSISFANVGAAALGSSLGNFFCGVGLSAMVFCIDAGSAAFWGGGDDVTGEGRSLCLTSNGFVASVFNCGNVGLASDGASFSVRWVSTGFGGSPFDDGNVALTGEDTFSFRGISTVFGSGAFCEVCGDVVAFVGEDF